MENEVTINLICDALGVPDLDPGRAVQWRSVNGDGKLASEAVVSWSEDGDRVELGLSEWASGDGNRPICSLTFNRHPDDNGSSDDPRFVLDRRSALIPSGIYEDSDVGELLGELKQQYISSMSRIN